MANGYKSSWKITFEIRKKDVLRYINHTQAAKRPKNVFVLVTLVFKLVRARDKTRLLHEFGTICSAVSEIFHTQTKQEKC